jgi:hypothetical protein
LFLLASHNLAKLRKEREARHIGADISNSSVNLIDEFELNNSYWIYAKFRFTLNDLNLLEVALEIPWIKPSSHQKKLPPKLVIRISLYRLAHPDSWQSIATCVGGGGVVDDKECTSCHQRFMLWFFKKWTKRKLSSFDVDVGFNFVLAGSNVCYSSS